ncbi:bacteriochlorophyll 4-vinyl reductase [Roseomonas alkaliterrae]|jgi:divinyl protochlorophyllide a 8-vinyl-reductase|uniref:Divinyl protochlorophyllide a 8-vinyl-reductase n=1 Tax=Neoroseomonas alkaliterrae TaxID=1452450 RepID=A0A840Y5G5_9PROT|nr:bacteriochlorophyll 4-vinyl reductase [Neoroseomonas alkaliterrae]MBB5689862.1 divinyl protochlorophyllide a 8-vinyl-reductase [Neoroseomonas alkaliterrae]MBR0675166.1 bacteriochlorophyll 4-vinyl reductase [Neoroseomonas alkaliterrae]
MAGEAARIGPNAVTRLAEALEARRGPVRARDVFARAGLADLLEHPPERMVPEETVAALHGAMRCLLPADEARRIAADAGRRTAGYLLAHRIPCIMRVALPVLPRRIATRILLAAMARHAWTFAGSGRFEVLGGAAPRFALRGGALLRGGSADAARAYLAATFEGLFQALTGASARVGARASVSADGPVLLFDLFWTSPKAFDSTVKND